MSFFRQTAIFGLLLISFACADKVDPNPSCGCDGQVLTTLSQEDGQIQVLQIGRTRLFRIFVASKTLYLSVCDSTTLSQSSKISNTLVRFSGQVKRVCSQPNEQPMDSPVRITQISKL